MPISDEVENWLEKSGYRNLCFISYPHSPEIIDFARRLASGIEDELRLMIRNPVIFLDTSLMRGSSWSHVLAENLARSVCMIAILVPVYFSSEYCGREWMAMERLAARRSANSPSIIPVLFRKTTLPSGVAELNHIDMSRVSLLGRRFYATAEFRKLVIEIVNQIEQIAMAVFAARAEPGANDFVLPDRSAFDEYIPPSLPAPFRERERE